LRKELGGDGMRAPGNHPRTEPELQADAFANVLRKVEPRPPRQTKASLHHPFTPLEARLGTMERWNSTKTAITGTLRRITPAIVTVGKS